MKGNADCHIYSSIGKDSHDEISWSTKCSQVFHMRGRTMCKLRWEECRCQCGDDHEGKTSNIGEER